MRIAVLKRTGAADEPTVAALTDIMTGSLNTATASMSSASSSGGAAAILSSATSATASSSMTGEPAALAEDREDDHDDGEAIPEDDGIPEE